MGVVFNGVTITAGTNKFYFNGTSVKDVYFNGVHVWSGLPTFSAGTGYQAVSIYALVNVRSWTTVGTSTFLGGDGSTCSVRAYAAHGSAYDAELKDKTYGRVLKNGVQLISVYDADESPNYSAFVTTSVNYGDVFTFQTYGRWSSGTGGGQIYTSTNSSGYWS